MQVTGSSRFTLVPSDAFDEGDERSILEQVCTVSEQDAVHSCYLEEYGAVAIYCSDGSAEDIPQLRLLSELSQTSGNLGDNVTTLTFLDGKMYLAIRGKRGLLLCSDFPAPDFNTGMYFFFSALKSHRINPESMAVICLGEIAEEDRRFLLKHVRSLSFRGI